jgi:hypothetical protein
MRRHASCLDEVTRPALVHFDLWDGNVFVERSQQNPGAGGIRSEERSDEAGSRRPPGAPSERSERIQQNPEASGWRVTGFIDGERAFYGDPVAELASLSLFREVEPELLNGVELSGTALRRLDLYRTYLYVIMAIEGATRGWYDEERVKFEAWLAERIDAQLALL